jgi:hypothetical protein
VLLTAWPETRSSLALDGEFDELSGSAASASASASWKELISFSHARTHPRIYAHMRAGDSVGMDNLDNYNNNEDTETKAGQSTYSDPCNQSKS